MQPAQAKRIRAKIKQVATDPYAQHNNVTKLQGVDGYRLRVGDYRIIYELQDNVMMLLVVDVDVRGNIYS